MSSSSSQQGVQPPQNPLLTLAEAVLEAAGQVAQVAHAAGASRLAADGLLAPLVCRV
jgi:hypothetical protein